MLNKNKIKEKLSHSIGVIMLNKNKIKEKLSHSIGVICLSIIIFPLILASLFLLKLILNLYIFLSVILAISFSISIYVLITGEFGNPIESTVILTKLGKLTVKILNIKISKNLKKTVYF